MFAVHGEMMDIYASTDKHLRRLYFNDTTLEHIQLRDPLTFAPMGDATRCTIWPATQFLQNLDDMEHILAEIKGELDERVARFTKL